MLKKHLKWDITGNCNLKCKHCLTGDKYKNLKKTLSKEERRIIIDKLKEGGVHLVNLLGGEPLLLQDDLLDLSKYCNESGIRLTLNTNGTLLTKEFSEKLFNSGCKGITVSIDGPTKEIHDSVRGQNSFEKIVKNLKELKELNYFNNNVSFTVNTVLNKHNMKYIPEMIELVRSLGAHKWILLPLVVTGYASDNKNELCLDMEDKIYVAKEVGKLLNQESNVYKDMVIDLQFSYPPLRKLIEHKTGLKYPETQHCCMAGTTLGFIDPVGVLYPCDRIAADYTELKLNDSTVKPMSLLEHSFDEIWNQKFYNELYSFVCSNEAYKNYDPCNRCEYLKLGICIPCPLFGTDYPKIVYDFCLEAEKELGPSALKANLEEKENCFRYSGQFSNLKRNKVNSSSDNTDEKIKELILKKTEWVREHIQKEGAELFNAKSNKFYQLNLLGKEIWKNINGESKVDQIVSSITSPLTDKKMQEEYYKSSISLISQMLENNMVEVAKQTETSIK